MSIWAQLTSAPHPDPYIRRRGRLLAIVLLSVMGLAALFIPVGLLSPQPALGVAIIVGCILLYAGVLRLVQLGHIIAGGWLFCLILVGAIVGSLVAGAPLTSVFYLVIAVVAAGLVLPPAHIWRVLLLTLIGAATPLLIAPEALLDAQSQALLIGSALLLGGTAFLSYLGGRATDTALRAADTNAQQAEAAQGRAEEQARALELQAAALSAAEERLRDLVATLETPVVALADGILLAPIIGTIDSRRAQTLTERLLASIAGQRVRLLILDIAGVATVDTAVSAALIRIAQAVRLLGCAVVITGISPAVAVTLTGLGASLEGITTARSPQEVLAARGPVAALAARPDGQPPSR